MKSKMLSYFLEDFPTHGNDWLSNEYNISICNVKRIANRFGVRKDKEHISRVNKNNAQIRWNKERTSLT